MDQGDHIHSCDRSIYDNISENDDHLISSVHRIDSNDRIFYAETCIKAGGSVSYTHLKKGNKKEQSDSMDAQKKNC